MDKVRKLFNIARRYLVGGVDSPVRSFNYVGIRPLLIKAGKGARVYDYNNRKYIDYVLSWGAAILGHAHSQVIKSIKQILDLGLSFGTTNEAEVELAKEIIRAIPTIGKIRFVSSGTEAVMGAVRLARAYTGRDKIVKFSHSYHGHADYLLAKAGSGLATQQIPLSKGVPNDFIKHTIVASFGDISVLEKIFKQNKGKIAAVLVEPVGGNYGVLPPNVVYLKKLRTLTKKYKTLLIFDEVITGFRFRYGAVYQNLGVIPDLICLGKIIGGGLPIGAYGASAKIMNNLAPLGKVYQASTFSGNPIVMRAGLSTLKILKQEKDNYQRIKELTDYLCVNLKKIARVNGVSLELNYYGSMFSFKFQTKDQFVKFYRLMFKAGIFFAPSEFEANFLSFAHSKRDIENTLSIAKTAFKKMER
ncbi:MAG: glutamate-1-semialdehyde 2,1-aminomutase [Candidatus Omnitrophota bacterium]